MSHNRKGCSFIIPFNNVLKLELIIKLKKLLIQSSMIKSIELIVKPNSNVLNI